MRIEQLNAIVALSQNNSISKTAEKLYLSQPSLSRNIAATEKELGITIFNRTNRGITLTPIGEKLLPHIKAIVSETEQIHNLIDEEKQHSANGVLNIVSSALLCNNFLLDVVDIFNQNYPFIDVDISEKFYLEILNSLQNNEATLGFFSTVSTQKDSVNDFDKLNLVAELLMQSPMVVVMSKNSPLVDRDYVTEEQLSPYPLVANRKAQYILSPFTNDERQILYASDRDARNKLILKRNAITMTSALEMYNDPYVNEGTFIIKPILNNSETDNIAYFSVYFVYPKNHTLSFYERDFINIVKETLKNIH